MTYFAAAVTVLVAMLASAAGIFLVRRLFPLAWLNKNHEIGGLIFLQVGVLYAVLVGFVVVASWDDFQDASRNVEVEAATVGDIARLGQQLDSPTGDAVKAAALAYMHAVVDDEWKAMEHDRPSERARAASIDLWRACLDLDPKTPREQVILDNMVDRLSDARERRDLRLVNADVAIPTYMWILLIVGGAILVNLTFFFGMENSFPHYVLTALLAGTIAFSLTLALVLNHPFSGDLRVSPEAFQKTIDLVESE